MQSRVLVIYGSFGVAGLNRLVTDWSKVDILEFDAFADERLLKLGASLIPRTRMMDHERAENEYARVRNMFDAFLNHRGTYPGIDTSRSFRAACLGAECFKIATCYLWNLDIARKLMAEKRWERIIVSPGTGVSSLSWKQMAEALGIPLVQLPFDREKPPFLWMLRRRLNKWKAKRRAKPASAASGVPKAMREAGPKSEWICADSRLEPLLARADDSSPWHKLTPLVEPSAEELGRVRADYLEWWKSWWENWKSDSANQTSMSEGPILETIGKLLCSEVYPRRFLQLQQARKRLEALQPQAMLFGAMRGKQELMWLLAAQERGIPTGAVTLDDQIDPLIAFDVDRVFCDDARQQEMALFAKMEADRVRMIRTHRAPPPQPPRTEALLTENRGLVVMAGTYFSGQRIGALPSVNLWAVKLLVETARLMPDHDFLFKPHPIRERPEQATHWTGFHHLHLWQIECFVGGLRPPSNFRLLQPEANLAHLMQKTDVLVNIESYAAFEAYALGIPVVHVCPAIRGWKAFEKLIEMGAEQVADTPPKLAECLGKNLRDALHIRRQTELQQEFLRGFYSLDAPPLDEAALSAFDSVQSQTTKL